MIARGPGRAGRSWEKQRETEGLSPVDWVSPPAIRKWLCKQNPSTRRANRWARDLGQDWAAVGGERLRAREGFAGPPGTQLLRVVAPGRLRSPFRLDRRRRPRCPESANAQEAASGRPNCPSSPRPAWNKIPLRWSPPSQPLSLLFPVSHRDTPATSSLGNNRCGL